jgi:hypothetical protein
VEGKLKLKLLSLRLSAIQPFHSTSDPIPSCSTCINYSTPFSSKLAATRAAVERRKEDIPRHFSQRFTSPQRFQADEQKAQTILH